MATVELSHNAPCGELNASEFPANLADATNAQRSLHGPM